MRNKLRILLVAALTPCAAYAQSDCELAANTLDNEAAAVEARVAAAAALEGCERGDDRPRVIGDMLHQLYAADARVRQAARDAIQRAGLMTAVVLTRLPSLEMLDRRARRVVDARFHDPNTTVYIVEDWRARHVCEGVYESSNVIVRCGIVTSDCSGTRHHFSVDFAVGPRGLEAPRLRQRDTADGGQCE